VKRRLTTILATDAVGYSRLMSESEEETARILAAHRAVIDGIIQFHDGRIFDTAGDSVLAEFGSPVQAVRCAVEIQDALKTRNDSLPENRRMMFRIGINLGDVMVKGTDLLGDGINVAARLESIAEPGGICIASSVYDQISGKLNLNLTDIGEQALKNITRPIRAYRIQSTGLPQTPRPAPARKKSRRPWLAAAGLALLAAAAGAVFWQQRGAEQARETAQTAAAAQRLRDEVEAMRHKAEADAAKIRAEAEADKAKAEADAMRAKAKADADAMLAKAKAETDAARIKAKAEAAAAKEREAAARAAAKTPPVQVASLKPAVPDAARYDGTWRLKLSCPEAEGFHARENETFATITAGAIAARFGMSGVPGYFDMRGTLERNDTLVLQGSGVAGGKHRGKEFIIYIPGRFEAGAYRGEGKFGGRRCVVTLAR
jgi:class 3 adenylate cyclase